MMKKILIIVFCGLFLSACGQQTATTSESTDKPRQGQSTDSSGQADSSTANSATQSSMANHLITGQLGNDEAKEYIQQAFYKWAKTAAKERNQAVSDWYFAHGAAGFGDWFANTTDGQMQMRTGDRPGKAAFPLHCVAGVVFYTAQDGTIGADDLQRGSFADNYKLNMDTSQPVSKYILGDNGVVYELKTGNGEEVTTATGFSQYDDEEKHVLEEPPTFQVSQDEAAQKELQRIIRNYQNL